MHEYRFAPLQDSPFLYLALHAFRGLWVGDSLEAHQQQLRFLSYLDCMEDCKGMQRHHTANGRQSLIFFFAALV